MVYARCLFTVFLSSSFVLEKWEIKMTDENLNERCKMDGFPALF
jgi:hypothetical protein